MYRPYLFYSEELAIYGEDALLKLKLVHERIRVRERN